MKNILVIGAGRSSAWLIKYLLEQSVKCNFKIIVGDITEKSAKEKLAGHSNGKAIAFDALNEKQREREIKNSSIVISMLPAKFHYMVAKACLRLKKDMITASYVSPEIKELDKDARKAGIIILNEMGVDPGLDHISAMQIIDRIRDEGGKITSFESFTGGLVAPESDNNPWHYKFTWNPRNVVIAGQGCVKFIQEGQYKYIPYHKLFSRTEKISIPGCGNFEGYANRDSLKYREVYGLHDIATIYRGTLRFPGFCKSWNLFVQLGATDDSFIIEGTENMTYRQFINSFLLYRPHDSVELKLCYHLGISMDSDEMEMLKWLGIFENTRIGLKKATPAEVLQKILEKKWNLSPQDKDMIVMLHRIIYKKNGSTKQINSHLMVIGDYSPYTAMAKTVGLPLAIGAKLILTGKIKGKGVQLPITKEIYEPVLKELKKYGIVFME